LFAVIGGASLANPLLGVHVLGLGKAILHLSLVLFTFFFLINEMTHSSHALFEKKNMIRFLKRITALLYQEII
jgi:CHASE3 domain sensor protein